MAAPSRLSTRYPVDCSQGQYGVNVVQFPAGYARRRAPSKTDVDFREASRREDADLLRAAFPGPSQQAIARAAATALNISERQAIYYLQLEHDMPSWAVKALNAYLAGLDRLARRIEGSAPHGSARP